MSRGCVVLLSLQQVVIVSAAISIHSVSTELRFGAVHARLCPRIPLEVSDCVACAQRL